MLTIFKYYRYSYIYCTACYTIDHNEYSQTNSGEIINIDRIVRFLKSKIWTGILCLFI